MKHYLRVYRALLHMNIANLFVYRGNFINMAVSNLMWALLQFVSIILLTTRVGTVYGWTREELILLTASYTFIWGFFHLFFARNFGNMSQIINFGELDGFLLKPIDSQFLLTTNTINLVAGAVRIGLGITTLAVAVNLLHLSISFSTLLNYLVLSACGILLIYSFWFMITTLIIWFTTLTNLVDFLFLISGLSRYPTEMIRRGFAFLLPVMIFVVIPTKILLQKFGWIDLLWLTGMTLIFFCLSRLFWKFALRYYTSASS